MNAVGVSPYRGIGFQGWMAKWYAADTRRELPEFQKLAHRISTDLPSGSTVLEVAPGPGYLSIELARTGKVSVTALEISEAFVKMADASAAGEGVEVNFRHGDAAAMPLESAVFDFVICRAAFKKFSQPARALQEMYRVLKPGGQALILDLRREAPQSLIDSYVAGMQRGPLNSFITRRIFRHLVKTAYTEGELRGFLSQTDFKRFNIWADGIGYEARLHKDAAIEQQS